MAPGIDLNVTLEGKHLLTQMTGQEKIPIFPETQSLFFVKVIDAQLEFKKDVSGKVTQVILHQGGHNMVARRK